MTFRLINGWFLAIAVAHLSPVLAQNSTSAPLSSQKEDSQGDPSGAIRALENSSEGKKSAPVTIPKSGAEGASRTGGAPAATEAPVR